MNDKKPRYEIVQIRHHGVLFRSNQHARLLCTGMFHHYVVLLL